MEGMEDFLHSAKFDLDLFNGIRNFFILSIFLQKWDKIIRLASC